jgi:ribonuclease HII
MMQSFHALYPAYGFDQHKGYGTRDHLDALRRFGPTPLHRSTFRGVRPAAPAGLPFPAPAERVS